MNFWAIKFYPGEELLGTEVLLSEDVQRFAGYEYVPALCVFSSRDRLNAFSESVRLEMDSQYPEMSPVLEEIASGEIRPWDVVLTSPRVANSS